MSWLFSVRVCVFGKYQSANVTRLLAGFMADPVIAVCAHFWSYAAASDVHLIWFYINYESCSGLSYSFFC